MYETEANIAVQSGADIPSDVLSLFGRIRAHLVARTVLPWGEHCTECVWPTCYQTCDLYTPRIDGGCRRFVEGMVRIACETAISGYVLKIRFKRWAKLWAPGNLHLRSVDTARNIEERDRLVGTVLYQLPVPATVKKTVIQKRYGMKKRSALTRRPTAAVPSSFLIECFNPAERSIALSITVRSFDPDRKVPYQTLVTLTPGFHTLRISCKDIEKCLGLDSPFNIEIIPDDVGEEVTLYFGLIDFVKEAETTSLHPADTLCPKKIKCVVWDLDNTLWDGILVENGLDGIRLRPEVLATINELDRRGILHSIASKNNPDDALMALKKFGIDELFLCPQISWEPKGKSVSRIAERLNIGEDTMLFVDDSEFELHEVKATCPTVRVLNSEEVGGLLSIDACSVPITAEGMGRRQMYQMESARQEVARSFKDDYHSFLKHCEIVLNISSLSMDNIERVHELTQRTNQMNFSGNRYDRGVLVALLNKDYFDTYVLSCCDRFGNYGVVGFGLVDNREPRLTDLMFSCRVQAKRVEHAFLSFVLHKYAKDFGKDFYANYRKTARNAAAGKVFVDLGLEEVGVENDVTSLLFRKGCPIPSDEIINVVAPEHFSSVATYQRV